MNYDFWSLIPPVLAIMLALLTRQVYLSLAVGIWIGWVIINGGNPVAGTFDTVKAFVDVFKEEGNTRTILFTLLIGALIALIQRSGGVEGFITMVKSRLFKADDGTGKEVSVNSRRAQLLTALTGLFIFVESNISILTVGTLYRPIFDKLKLPREKLAYLADSSSAPSCIIFPFNAWGAYIMGLLLAQGFEHPFGTLLHSIPLNFYPLIALLIVFITIMTGKDIGPMKQAMRRARVEGKVLGDNAVPMIADDVVMITPKEGNPERSFNMLLPILIMILMMPVMLIYTGWQEVAATPGQSFLARAFESIGYGSGSASVLYSVLTSLLFSSVLYGIQRLFSLKEMTDLVLKGMGGMVSLALLMVMAFAIGNLCNHLGTGLYVANLSEKWLSPALVPAIVFAVSCFIAFATGTSWGTFAIMISIAVPMAQSFGIDAQLAVAAALGGGVFGDHCSPISDTTIISSMASASDHIDHVKTQLPYALIGGVITFLLYLLLGFLNV